MLDFFYRIQYDKLPDANDLHLQIKGLRKEYIMEALLDVLMDVALDVAKLIPFLFLTYWAMEFLEHKAGNQFKQWVQRSGKFGPVIGGVLGIVPQCGFSAAASGLYAGRVITMGTLIAIYLSTSDEMLPILISEQAAPLLIGKILLLKVIIGIVFGFLVDMVYHEKKPMHHIHEICEHDHCQCDKSIVKSALIHTLQIAFFLFIISLALEGVLQWIGEDALAEFILNRPVLGPILAGIVGLIPNCASSVIITKLYLEKTILFGTMLAGLLTNAGVGVLVLFRTNGKKKENLAIVGVLYGVGVAMGILFSFLVG